MVSAMDRARMVSVPALAASHESALEAVREARGSTWINWARFSADIQVSKALIILTGAAQPSSRAALKERMTSARSRSNP